ncbi:MAG: VIT domain-containing protein [Planctomycetota bacterium]
MLRKMHLLALVLVACAAFLAADGFIIIHPIDLPPDRPVPHLVPLSVKYHRVSVDIAGTIATTKIDQEFYNPNDMQLEGTYIFPLPEDAAIGKFALFINGVETQGEILESDKARQIYEDIVRRMKDPALLEYAGRKMFKARVFPIPPRGTRRIKLEYAQTLTADAGLFAYTYPLNTEKFSSAPLDEVLVDVTINADTPLRNVYCPTHKAEIKRDGDKSARVTYEERNVTPDRDLAVYFSMSDKEMGLSLASFKPAGKDGYFIAMLTPDASKDDKPMPKDVVFVFDTSGSMSGKKIKQAREALSFCLGALKPADRFGLVAFSTEARTFRKELAAADEAAVTEAQAFVDAIEARGGTNISEALGIALAMRGKEDRPFIVMFMTDGKPTLGLQGEDELVAAVKDMNKGGARVFVFGVGYELDTFILDRIADDSRGARSYVSPEEDIEIKISGLFTKLEHPVLADVTVEFPGKLDIYDVYPKTLPDLFRGSQVEIMGRYKGNGAAAIILKGKVNGAERKFVFEQEWSGTTPAGETIARLWATRKVFYLLDEIRLRGVKDELKEEVVRLAKEFGIITPYTSFLVLEDEPTVAGRPVPMDGRDRGIEHMRREARNAPAAPAAAAQREEAADAVYGRAKAGESAVGASRALEDGKKDQGGREYYMPGMDKEQTRALVRQVADRTFYSDGQVWIDSTYTVGATTKLVCLSDGYFAFLKANPGAGRFAALGSRVIFAWNGTFIEITE